VRQVLPRERESLPQAVCIFKGKDALLAEMQRQKTRLKLRNSDLARKRIRQSGPIHCVRFPAVNHLACQTQDSCEVLTVLVLEQRRIPAAGRFANVTGYKEGMHAMHRIA
jgi:hypothetical protein